VSDLGTKIIGAGLVDEGMAVEAMETELKKLRETIASGKPVCPICKCEMKQQNYNGYYDLFSYWECDCSDFPDGNTWNGTYV